MHIQNNLSHLILDKNWVKNFLEKNSLQIFKKEAKINILSIERSYTFNIESYNILYSFEIDSKKQDLRVSFSNQVSKETNYKILQYLYKKGFNKGNILVSEPYIFFKDYNLLLYENIPGRTLMHELDKDLEYLAHVVNLSARALKKIHKIPLPSLKLWHQDWNLNIPVMTKYYPELAKKINIIQSNIFNKLNKTKSGVFCHGDFQPNNIIFYKNKLYILDFGSVCVLDRELDIASFVIQLMVMLKKFGDIANLEFLREKFLTEYGEHDKEKFNLYSVLLSLRILDFFIVFPDAENNRERIPFGYELVKENLEKIGVKIDN